MARGLLVLLVVLMGCGGGTVADSCAVLVPALCGRVGDCSGAASEATCRNLGEATCCSGDACAKPSDVAAATACAADLAELACEAPGISHGSGWGTCLVSFLP